MPVPEFGSPGEYRRDLGSTKPVKSELRRKEKFVPLVPERYQKLRV
jgi:hypothetical protein